jgi:hypothetical protein
MATSVPNLKLLDHSTMTEELLELLPVNVRKSLHNQDRRSFPVAPATPRYLCKVRRSASRKEAQNQLLTRTALNPRSAEVWRQTGGEREFRASDGSSQCGGLCAKPAVIGDFRASKSSGESWSRKDWRRGRC